jgi:hypothetical protein
MSALETLKHKFINREIPPTNWLGDSPDRFETYQRYAAMVDSVVEFGVYTGLSTCAWIMGQPKTVRSYDITSKYLSVLDQLSAGAKELGVDFEFNIADSLKIEIEPTDLLFIDTVHTRDHCLAELERHGDKTKKYIVLHDPSDWPGVFEAVICYLKNHREWHIIEHCNKNSGLVVLERYCD